MNFSWIRRGPASRVKAKACNIFNNTPMELYYKKGANVGLGEKYVQIKLNNGSKVYVIDKSD